MPVGGLNSRVVLQLDDEQKEVALVYPQDADERSGKLSVLSDVGAAILGADVDRALLGVRALLGFVLHAPVVGGLE